MGILKLIKEKKLKVQESKRIKVQSKLKKIKTELKDIKAEKQVYSENAKLTKELRQSKKDLFEAKHPIISAGLKHAGKKIQENQKRNKNQNVLGFQDTASNFRVGNNKKSKGKRPGEGVFY